jgi:C4-dicarboxylate-specific signal transduction histidine kinase
MSETAGTSDLGLGLGLAFGAVSLVAAVGMYVGHANQVVAGASFAVAVTAGVLTVAAVHVYGS